MKIKKIFFLFIVLLSFTAVFAQPDTSLNKTELYKKFLIQLNTRTYLELISHKMNKGAEHLGELNGNVPFSQLNFFTTKNSVKIFNKNILTNNNLSFNFEKLIPHGSPVFSINYAEVYGLYSEKLLPLKRSCIY